MRGRYLSAAMAADLSAAMAAAVFASTPVAAQVKNPVGPVQPPGVPAAAIDPGDQAVLLEAAAVLSVPNPEIAALDALLAKLPRPTPLRAAVQTARALTLFTATESADQPAAVAAIEEALLLAPDEPYPMLIATYILTFAGAPTRAADLWVRMSQLAPDAARDTDSYYINALIGRLVEAGERGHADRIRAGLAAIGYTGGTAIERSASAGASVREAMRAGRVDEAEARLTAVGSPSELLSLYVDRAYEDLWPRIEQWAGPDLAGQTGRYLAGLRADWIAGADFEAAVPYARALSARDGDRAVVDLFMRLYPADGPKEAVSGSEYLTPVIARSLDWVGRRSDADALMDWMIAAWSEDSSGAVLNLYAAQVVRASLREDWAAVIIEADAFANVAGQYEDSINPAAFVRVGSLKACALWRSGARSEADLATAAILMQADALPDVRFALHLCRGDEANARRLLVAALASDVQRDWALGVVQPSIPSARPTPYDANIRPLRERVRLAPDVVAAAQKVGRILPRAIGDRLPEGFDPVLGTSAAR